MPRMKKREKMRRTPKRMPDAANMKRYYFTRAAAFSATFSAVKP